MNRDDLRRALEPYGLEGGPCPSPEEVLALAAGTMKDRDAEPLRAHLASCPACLETWLDGRSLSPSSLRPPTRGREEHGGRRRRDWALAASLAVAALGAGGSLWMWREARAENLRLAAEMARLQISASSPAPARLVELLPDTFAVRGGTEGLPSLPSGEAAALLLTTLEPLPEGVVARLTGPSGREVWRGPLPSSDGAPSLLQVPPGLLPPGPASVDLLDPATGALLLRFPFVIR